MIFFSPPFLFSLILELNVTDLGRMPKFNIVLMRTWIMYKETLQTVYKIWGTKCLTRLNQRLCKSCSRTNCSSSLKTVPSSYLEMPISDRFLCKKLTMTSVKQSMVFNTLNLDTKKKKKLAWFLVLFGWGSFFWWLLLKNKSMFFCESQNQGYLKG